VEIQFIVSLYTFGGPKVLFVGRFDLGGYPHGKFVLCTPWDKSLKFLIIGGKQ